MTIAVPRSWPRCPAPPSHKAYGFLIRAVVPIRPRPIKHHAYLSEKIISHKNGIDFAQSKTIFILLRARSDSGARFSSSHVLFLTNTKCNSTAPAQIRYGTTTLWPSLRTPPADSQRHSLLSGMDIRPPFLSRAARCSSSGTASANTNTST